MFYQQTILHQVPNIQAPAPSISPVDVNTALLQSEKELPTQTHCPSETSAKCTLRRGTFFCLWKETSESSKNKVEYFTVKHMIWGKEFWCCCSAGTVCGLLILFLFLLRCSFVRYHKAFLKDNKTRVLMKIWWQTSSWLLCRLVVFFVFFPFYWG